MPKRQAGRQGTDTLRLCLGGRRGNQIPIQSLFLGVFDSQKSGCVLEDNLGVSDRSGAQEVGSGRVSFSRDGRDWRLGEDVEQLGFSGIGWTDNGHIEALSLARFFGWLLGL